MKRSPILGYNHNMKHRGLVFHVQTEDSGVEKAHIFTHVFHGGVILKSRKLDYDAGSDEDAVKSLMQAQHKAALKELKGGVLDPKIDAYLGDNPNLLPSPAAFEAARLAAEAAEAAGDDDEVLTSAPKPEPSRPAIEAVAAEPDPITEAADAIAAAADAFAAAADAAEEQNAGGVVEMVADEPSEPILLTQPANEATQPIEIRDLIELDAEIPSGDSNPPSDELEAELEIVPGKQAPDDADEVELELIADEPDPESTPIPLMSDKTQRVAMRPPPIPERSDPAIIHDAVPEEIEAQRSAGSYSQVRRKRHTPGVPHSVDKIPTGKLPVVPPSKPNIEPPERETRSSQRIPTRPRADSASGSIPPRPRANSASGSIPTRPRADIGSGGIPPRPRADSGSGSIPPRRQGSRPIPPPPRPSSEAPAVGKRARESRPPPGREPKPPPPPSQVAQPNTQRGVVVSRPAVIIGAPPKQVGLESSATSKARAETRRTNPRLAREERSRSSLFGKDLISEKSLDEVILAYLSEDGSEDKK